MFIRAQFTGQAFKDLLRFRTASTSRPCPQFYFEASRIFISRIEFLRVSEIFLGPSRSVNYPNNAPTEQVFQGNRVGLKLRFKVAASELNASNDPIPFLEKEGTVSVALDVRVQNGKDFLTLEVLETDFDSLLSLVGVGKQEMSNLLAAEQVELGLLTQVASISQAAGGLGSVRHVDLGHNPELDRVELRCELVLGVPQADGPTQWTAFYANAFDSITGASAWALFVDQRVGSSLMQRVLRAEIDASGRFNRDGDVNVRWDGAFPGYRASLEGEFVDACWCVWDEIDLDMRLSADARFSLSNNRLRVDVWLDHKVTDAAEAACCLISAVVLFPVLGLYLAFKGDIAWYEYLAGMALYPTPILLLAAVIAKVGAQLGKGLPVQFCVKDPNDEKHFHCESELPVLTEAASCQGAKITVRTDSLTGRGDGLVIGGPIDMPDLADPRIGVEVTSPLRYRPPVYACSGGTSSPEQFSTELRVFRTTGDYDFRLCQVHVLGPFKYAAKVDISALKCPYSAWVKISIGFTQYDFEPLKVLLVTTHGAVHAVIPAAPRVSEDERKAAHLTAAAERINHCYAKSRSWDIRWLVDPAPYVNVVRTKQIWTIVGAAPARATRLTIIDNMTTPLAVVNTSRGPAFRVTFVSAAPQLSVIHEVEGEAEQLEDATLHAVQTLVGVERTFDFKSPVIGVDAIRMSPTRIVLVHERERATVFYIDDHGDMLRLGEFDTRDAEWVGRNAGKVYAGMRDGPLMQLSLESGVGFRWDKIKVQEPSQAVSRCACGEAIVEAPIAATVGRDFALQPEAGRFDYLLYKGKYLSEHLRGRARIRDGFWTADVDGTLVSVALYRQLKRGAEVLMENAMALMLVRVANGVYVAPGESRQQLEVLRAFGRREL